jgi:hypothetical protein
VQYRGRLFAFVILMFVHGSGGADLLGRGPEALCLNRFVGNPYAIAVGQLATQKTGHTDNSQSDDAQHQRPNGRRIPAIPGY